MPSSNKEVCCYIPPELLAAFKARFPMKQAPTWVLRTAMEELMRATEGQPDTADLVRDAMRLAVLRQRKHQKAQSDDTTEPTESKPAITIESNTVRGTPGEPFSYMAPE